MSGHSKWSTIKRSKGAADLKRSKLFSLLSKKITMAVKEGGSGDPAFNFKLRGAVEKAKEAKVPAENIERAIKKGVGGGADSNLVEGLFEGYGPFGSAFLVETITDNGNRASQSIRNLFNKSGGSLGASGSTAWLFVTVGRISVSMIDGKFEILEEKAIELGCEDVYLSGETGVVITLPENFDVVREGLVKEGFVIEEAEVTKVPKNPLSLSEEEMVKVALLHQQLEENEDVTAVYNNL